MIERIAEQLGLKRKGKEYAGPCLCCGGDDRFILSRGKKHDVLYYCRHGCNYAQITKELEYRGIVQKTPFDKPDNYLSKSVKDRLIKDRLYIAMYNDKINKGESASLQEWRKYRECSHRRKNIEARLNK